MLFEIVKSIAFFPIPSRLPCVIVPLLALLLLDIQIAYSIALTAAFGVIILHKLVQVPPQHPVDVPWGEVRDAWAAWGLRAWDTITWRKGKLTGLSETDIKNIDLPPGVGNRIPDV